MMIASRPFRSRLSMFASLLFCAIALLRSLIAAPAVGAQTPEPPDPNIVIYDAEVAFDIPVGPVRALWELTFTADPQTGGQVPLLLNSGLQIDRLGGEAVVGYDIVDSGMPDWSLILIDLDDSVEPGDIVHFELGYSGTLTGLPDDGPNRIADDWIELSVESMWHPMFATTDRAMSGVLRLALPEDWNVVSLGAATFEDGLHVVRNVTPMIDVPFLASLALASAGSDRFTVYHRGAEPERVRAVLDAAEACVAWIESRYAPSRPLPKARIVLTDREEVAYARATYMVILDQAHQPAARRTYEPQLCHELAHYWTAIGNFNGPNHWMSESFAEYVMALFLRENHGEEEFAGRVSEWRERGADAGPVWTPEASERPGHLVLYHLGPYVLYRLEQRIGRELFDRLVAAYFEQDIRRTQELLVQLEAIAGESAADDLVADLQRLRFSREPDACR